MLLHWQHKTILTDTEGFNYINKKAGYKREVFGE